MINVCSYIHNCILQYTHGLQYLKGTYYAKITIIKVFELGVDRLSAPILSILPIIDIGHFKNRFADIFFFMQTNILFTGDIIYW